MKARIINFPIKIVTLEKPKTRERKDYVKQLSDLHRHISQYPQNLEQVTFASEWARELLKNCDTAPSSNTQKKWKSPVSAVE